MLATVMDQRRERNALGPRCTDSAQHVVLSCFGILLGLLTGLLFCDTHLAQAFEIRGTVNDPQGKPISAVMITMAGRSVMGAKTVTVFTDHTGTYQTPELGQQVL